MFLKQELLQEVCFHIITDTLERILKHSERNSKLCTINTFTTLINKYEKKATSKKTKPEC